jgi:hypothetical protein
MFSHALSLGAGGASSASNWSSATWVALLSATVALSTFVINWWHNRPRIHVRTRRGDWTEISETQTGKEVIFNGIVEVYNLSSRANAIREYNFWWKRAKEWVPMGSERYTQSERVQQGAEFRQETWVSNATPLAIAPYSGAEVHVAAFAKVPVPSQILIRVELKDLFGKTYRTEVKANDKKPW